MISLVLVSVSWNRKRTLKLRGRFADRKAAAAERARLERFSESSGGADYRICGPRQLAALKKEILAEQAERRAKGAKRAAATRKKRGEAAFVKCPHCGAKSKKLRSEMGGLQTRRCQRGHVFEFDKWIADRLPVLAIFGGR